MLDIDFTFLWTLVNLGILYLFLKKILFKRVGDFMKKRADGIAQSLADAQTDRDKATEYLQEQQKKLENAAQDKQQLINDARKQAKKEADVLVAQAHREASRIIAEANLSAEREYQHALAKLRHETALLAINAASKVIGANVDTDKNRALVKEFLESGAVA